MLSTCSYINITSCFLIVFLIFPLRLCKQTSLLKTTLGIQPFFNNLPFIRASHIIFSLVFSFSCISVIERFCLAAAKKNNLNVHAMKGFAPFVPHKVLNTSPMSQAPRIWKAAVQNPRALSSPGSSAPELQRRGLCSLPDGSSLRLVSAPHPTSVGSGKASPTPPAEARLIPADIYSIPE